MIQRRLRSLHKFIAPIVMLPLVVTVFTGVTYRLSKDWFGWTRDQAHWLMVIHEGEYLGERLKSVYVLLNGLGLLWMLVTGGTMWFQSVRQSLGQRKPVQQAESDA